MNNQVQHFENRISSFTIQLENTLTELQNNANLLNTAQDSPRVRHQCRHLLYQVTQLFNQSVILCGRLLIFYSQHIDDADAVNMYITFQEQCQSFSLRISDIIPMIRNRLQLNRTVLNNPQIRQQSRFRRFFQILRRRFSCL